MKKKENVQREAAKNQGGERRTQVTVVMEIPRRRELRARLTTMYGEDRNLKMRDSGEIAAVEGLEESQHGAIKMTDTKHPTHADITI